jgi:hypothetical protein
MRKRGVDVIGKLPITLCLSVAALRCTLATFYGGSRAVACTVMDFRTNAGPLKRDTASGKVAVYCERDCSLCRLLTRKG